MDEMMVGHYQGKIPQELKLLATNASLTTAFSLWCKDNVSGSFRSFSKSHSTPAVGDCQVYRVILGGWPSEKKRRTEIGPKTVPNRTPFRACSPNHSQIAPKSLPNQSQIGPKSVPNRSPDRFWTKLDRFWTKLDRFWAVLDRFWPLWGWGIGPKSVPKSLPNRTQIGPKSDPNRSAQGTPKHRLCTDLRPFPGPGWKRAETAAPLKRFFLSPENQRRARTPPPFSSSQISR